MTHRERVQAVLHYQDYDALPVVAFRFWKETLEKWAAQGHISRDEARDYSTHGTGSPGGRAIMDKLGFDFHWGETYGGQVLLYPAFEQRILREDANGTQLISDEKGHIVRIKPNTPSIPSEEGTLLTGRAAWEELFLPKLQDGAERVDMALIDRLKAEEPTRKEPIGIWCGSMYGSIRDMLGVVHLSYLTVDDEDLYREIIDTVGNLAYQVVKRVLDTGVTFDYAHFWEDICFKNGPLVNPKTFDALIGPHYRRITDLLSAHGIDIVSLDCDGFIDALVPTWIENGVNTMFPIEVGTWGASLAPWRQKYGKELRGVGGMDKRVFARDRAAVDAEIERLKPLVDLGGYIPCPDHLIAPDAHFDVVQYYCDRFRKAF
ncbi:MAG: hypothetical protein PHO66_01400 [Eubacteriales bacterium]|nr:hypothetical protein [Eubacteriales bacterium]